MKATIYALVDPNTHQVRYVGRTRQKAAQRLAHHIGAAKRGNKQPVYEWISSLLPAQPVLVILQEGIVIERKGSGTYDTRRYWNTAEAAETKWMKRFERSQLLCSISRDSGAYRSLVNPPGVKARKKR
jgi:hypothetical protein